METFAAALITLEFLSGKVMLLQPEAEEVASFYSKMLEHEYTSKEVFNKNFFKDWKRVSVSGVVFVLQTWKLL